jgi:ethanolamine utilization microcompartment shell protein EutL
MSSDNLVENIIAEVLGKVGDLKTPSRRIPAGDISAGARYPKKTLRFNRVRRDGNGDSIGLVIANVDSAFAGCHASGKYRSIGILGARTGAGPQIMAADEAVKATNTEVVAIELARDTKGGAGHGSLVLFGGQDVSDVKRAVEVALGELERTFGDIYANAAGHVELQYTARASYALEKAFGAPLDAPVA